jgi:hypothetical protein
VELYRNPDPLLSSLSKLNAKLSTKIEETMHTFQPKLEKAKFKVCVFDHSSFSRESSGFLLEDGTTVFFFLSKDSLLVPLEEEAMALKSLFRFRFRFSRVVLISFFFWYFAQAEAGLSRRGYVPSSTTSGMQAFFGTPISSTSTSATSTTTTTPSGSTGPPIGAIGSGIPSRRRGSRKRREEKEGLLGEEERYYSDELEEDVRRNFEVGGVGGGQRGAHGGGGPGKSGVYSSDSSDDEDEGFARSGVYEGDRIREFGGSGTRRGSYRAGGGDVTSMVDVDECHREEGWKALP